ncbi:unnamed protein product [Discosporangium mesarthrocarpum]
MSEAGSSYPSVAEAFSLAMLSTLGPSAEETTCLLQSAAGKSTRAGGGGGGGGGDERTTGMGDLPLPAEASGSATAAAEGSWEEIFEEEESNQHAEPALFVSLSLPHLRKALALLRTTAAKQQATLGIVDPGSRLHASCIEVLSQLGRGLKALPEAVRRQPDVTWSPDVFGSLMGALEVGSVLVAAVAAGLGGGPGSGLFALAQEVGRYAGACDDTTADTRGALHPEVGATLAGLARAAQAGTTVEWDEDVIWDGGAWMTPPLGPRSP